MFYTKGVSMWLVLATDFQGHQKQAAQLQVLLHGS